MGSSIKISNDNGKSVDVMQGDSLVLRYNYAVAKVPFIDPLCVEGRRVTLRSPHDHVHHRGLMFATRANGLNFWEEIKKPEYPADEAFGKIVHRGWETEEAKDGGALLVEKLDWVSTEGERPVMAEKRTVRLLPSPKAGWTLLDWQSELRAEYGDVEFSGRAPLSKVSYYGLGIRFPRAMDFGGRHINSDGKEGAEATMGARAKWHDYSSKLDETLDLVGVSMFDHPSNPRHPTEWFIAGAKFAYVGACLTWSQPFAIKKGDSATLRYGVAAHLGHPSTEEIEGVYRGWVK